MENLSHALLGATLAKAGLERRTPYAIPILLVSSNIPDIEIFSGSLGLNYFDYHRAFTHSVFGILILSNLLSFALCLSIPLLFRDSAKHLKFGSVWMVCFAGMASHLLLDFLNDYGIRPWLPFSSHRYYGDLLPIANPWLWLVLGAAVYVSTRPYKYKVPLALLFAAAAAMFVFWGGALWLMISWLLTLALALWANSRLMRRKINVSLVAICVCIIYLSGLAAVRVRVMKSAAEILPALIPEKIERIDVLPQPRMRWTIIAETAQKFYLADVSSESWGDQPPGFEGYDKNLDKPWFKEALSRNEIASIFRFARFPSAHSIASPQGTVVILRDLRYARGDTASGFGTARTMLAENKE
jgi:inner membrane protein